MTTIISGFPYTFTDGTTAYGSQVQANFASAQTQINAGAAESGANSSITSLSGLTTPLSQAQGGTGSATGNPTFPTITTTGTATFGGNVTCTGTGDLQLPAGTTGQRPGSPASGMIRFNTTLNTYEGYNAATASWTALSVTQLGEIAGLMPSSITGSHTTASLTVASGQATDSTGAASILSSGSISWAVSNGNAINGYQGGTTLPNSTTIHFFICSGSSGVGTFASTSLTPTLPTGYNSFYRRIFSLVTSGAGAPLGGNALEIGGGAMLFYLAAPVADVNGSNMSTGGRTAYATTVPTGISVEWMGNANAATSTAWLLTSIFEPDSVPATGTTNALQDQASQSSYVLSAASRKQVITDTSGNVCARSANAVPVYIFTHGWIDFRRT